MPRSSGSSGGGRTYVNNAMNRSLGRVGMAVGSAPVSRSTGGSTSYNSGSSYNSFSSGSASRTYVDNSQNRSLGRVGMPVGSAPVSRSSGNTASSSFSGNTRIYVDNSQNRSLGRVGMAIGSAPLSRSAGNISSKGSGSSNKTYVDNSQNRSLGRVGMPVGSAPVSRSSGSSKTINQSIKTYVDNHLNRQLGRVGKPIGSAVLRSSEYDQRKQISKAKILQQKYYVDNSYNRKYDRVGLPLGSCPVSKNSKHGAVREAFRNYHGDIEEGIEQYNMRDLDTSCQGMSPVGEFDVDQWKHIREMFERMLVWQEEKEQKYAEYSKPKVHETKRPPTHFQTYKGAVIPYEDLQIKDDNRIGHGSFGDIYKAKWQGKVVAIKKLRVQRVSRKRLAQFEEEIDKFQSFDHRNIIKFYGACIKTPNLCMVMELMEGSLHDKLHIEEFQFTEENKFFITQEIANGLDYLHSQNAAHCDIKSSNILIDVFNQNKINVKLTDFGLTMMKNDMESSNSSSKLFAMGVGTPKYSAPEVLRGEYLDRNAMKMTDVYSYGLVVYEIYSEAEPFEDLNIHQLRKQVGEGNLTPVIESNVMKNTLMLLVKRCWFRNPRDRPIMKEVVRLLEDIG